ncbi:hypothetical protein XA68_12305 [Ophiocordyceps unilateralis]|uniref:MI domain-containing protein n=1 Tax=Ophiocordyceps unilateralis TaxID=268505 RepID=A0A2A9PEY8_OPHUN|nr:hypothetical protein XA68_12305 [Ophiocordyceps unilateralis]
MKINLPAGQEAELPSMIVECCSQEKTYTKFFGLIGERFAKINRLWCDLFEQAFAKYYDTIHRYENNKLRNMAMLFGHMLAEDAIGWHCLSVIHLNEEETTSSSRIFIKILFQSIAEELGMPKLKARMTTDEVLRPSLAGLFPDDSARNMRFSINYFTSIGMGALTEELRERLQTTRRIPGLRIRLARVQGWRRRGLPVGGEGRGRDRRRRRRRRRRHAGGDGRRCHAHDPVRLDEGGARPRPHLVVVVIVGMTAGVGRGAAAGRGAAGARRTARGARGGDGTGGIARRSAGGPDGAGAGARLLGRRRGGGILLALRRGGTAGVAFRRGLSVGEGSTVSNGGGMGAFRPVLAVEAESIAHRHGPPVEGEPFPDRRGPLADEESTASRRPRPADEESTARRHGPPVEGESIARRHGPPVEAESLPDRHGPLVDEESTARRHGPPVDEESTARRHGPPVEAESIPDRHGPLADEESTASRRPRPADEESTASRRPRPADEESTARRHGPPVEGGPPPPARRRGPSDSPVPAGKRRRRRYSESVSPSPPPVKRGRRAS